MGPSGRFTLVWIILHCLGQVYAGFVFGQERVGPAAGRSGAQARQERAGRAVGRLGRAERARQGRTSGVQTCGLCAPGHAGWGVGYALGALSLFFTQFRLSTVFESILGGNFVTKRKIF